MATVVTANLQLEVGDVSQSVTVSAEATQLQSSSSELGYSVSDADYHAWPIDSNDDGQRQIQAFIFNSLPGTIGDSYQGTINGGPQFSHEILIEGMSIGRADIAGDTAEYTPSVDAVSEFTLQTGRAQRPVWRRPDRGCELQHQVRHEPVSRHGLRLCRE